MKMERSNAKHSIKILPTDFIIVTIKLQYEFSRGHSNHNMSLEIIPRGGKGPPIKIPFYVTLDTSLFLAMHSKIASH
jgi:hypothetical protein